MKIELALLALCAAQALSGYLSTATLHAALSDSMPRFVTTAAISDTVKLTCYAWVVVLAVRGTWWGVAAAVLGGAVGNAVAHWQASRKP